MGLFGTSSPFDSDIEKATSEKNTTEQWGVIIEICDKVGTSSANAKECLKSIMRRLAHNDPHVVIQAITLLDACVNNCGKNFHLEVASRDFENEYKRLVSKNQPQVAAKLVGLLKKWAEGDFKSDPQLNLIPSLYQKIKSEGHDYSEAASTPKQQATFSKDPNVVQSQQEADDIAKAIELSLKDKTSSPKSHSTVQASSLYPSMSLTSTTVSTTAPPSGEARKVRALYDFEAAEDNELTFQAGEIIHVVDDSDPNWWKGYNQRGEGLFPSNFVTADLSVEPESLRIDNKLKKSVQFADEIKKEDVKDEPIEINEEKIDRLLHLLHEANPEDPSQDSAEMLNLENQVNHMGPLIDAELERVDRKHAQLTQLSSDLVEAINLYHTLMREPEKPSYMGYNQGQSLYGPSSHGMPSMAGMYAPQHHHHHQMYQLPSNLGPTSLPPMHMMAAPQAGGPMMMPPAPAGHPQPHQGMTNYNVGPPSQQQQQQHLPQQHQMVPPQLQNGHSGNILPSQQHQQIPTNVQSQQPQQQLSNHPIAPPGHNFPPSGQQSHQFQQPQQHQTPISLPPQQQMISGHPQQMGGPINMPQASHLIHSAQSPQQVHLQHQHVSTVGGSGGGGGPPIHQGPQALHIMTHNQMLGNMSGMMGPTSTISSTILSANDSKTSIPIYQQQRMNQ